jgi:hypothetical protein
MRRGVTVKGLTSAFTLSALLFVPFGLWSFGIQPPGIAKAAPPPSLAVIQTLSELATTRVHLNDFIDGENSHYKGRWTLHGEVILGVNLAGVSYVQSHPDKREAVLRLPQPHLIASKVDHERSEEVYVKAAGWFPTSSPRLLHDEVWKQADRKIQRLGLEPGYSERAKVQAERVLQNLFSGLGWTVRFEWEG